MGYQVKKPASRGTTDMCTYDNNLVLLVPQQAWDTLIETLTMDMQSGAIDPAIRREIEQALAQVVDITHKVQPHDK